MSTTTDIKDQVLKWVPTVGFTLLSIIGWQYVKGQNSLEKQIESIDKKVEVVANEGAIREGRIIKLESDISYTKQTLDEIKTEMGNMDKKLDRLLEK